jgi:lipopolysaccharide export system protein LptA
VHTKKQKNTQFIAQTLSLCVFMMLFCVLNSYAQQSATVQNFKIPVLARPRVNGDTLLKSRGIGIQIKNTIDTSKIDTTLFADSDLKSMVVYNAKDSTIMDPDNQEVHLYGNAKVTYGSIVLEANYIKLNWKTNEVFAKGMYDSTAKKIVGDPVFQDGDEKYDSKQLRYNFKSRKGIIGGIVTQQGDGNIRGESVKKDADDNLYIRGSKYTTCDLEHPHFYISSKKLKVVANKQVISGPFHLNILDIPIKPVGLPFGYFPIPKKKEIGTSGVLMPTYGEEPNGRGFYLRGGGYYWAISERINLILTTQIYTKGSWGLGFQSSYATKYRYSGNLAFNYNRNVLGSEIKALNDPRNDFSLSWSHSPVPRGTSSFGASVNLGSNSYNQNNAVETQRYIQNVASSSVQYSKQFGQYGRAGTSLRVNQRFPDRAKIDPVTGKNKDPGTIDAGLDFNMGLNQIAPFALKGGIGRWYESFRLGMDFNGGLAVNTNRNYADTTGLGFILTNKIDTTGRSSGVTTFPVNGENIEAFLKNAQFRGQYSVPISLPNFKLLKYFNFTPGVSLSGEVFTKRFQYNYLGKSKMQVDTIKGINLVNQVAFNIGMNTRMYGMFFIKGKRLEAIRHTIIPSLSFSYVPDQSNLYQRVQVNDAGDKRYLNKYRTIGGPQGGIGQSAAGASWSINNLIEAKVRPKNDSTGKEFEKISILDNLSINGSYDFTRDSLRASNISMNTNARLFKNLDFNIGANFDPYSYVADGVYGAVGRKTNNLALTMGQGLMRLSNLNVAFNTRFAPKGADKPKKSDKATEEQLRMINNNPDLYVDFDIPWSLNLSYNFGYSRNGLDRGQTIQTLRLNGDFSLTQKWKFVFDTGYDFETKGPSITNLRISRDLHCWEMSFDWTPFAATGSQRASNYSFDLRVKSALLKDLKISRRRSFYDRGGF